MKRRHGLILILLLLGFGLRVWNLAGQSFWWDEAFTWQTTSHGPANLWQMLLTGDRNPPLYFVSVAAWGSVAGWSEFSLRFVSVFWMMIGLAFLFNLAKRLYNTSAGWWTLALAAV
ncbi:MAG TPA: glycosyltransferase family 39 protein, partial [Anaerolineae bacterium]|nr:glycosyltransferase family 39 protein [Anaerolineae bacterium]